ncbi:MAG TPA: hypothetical protein VFB20_08845 [Burkholderiales bacterium]|nr:hypothetical protein [Burkholderiales bacterium]
MMRKILGLALLAVIAASPPAPAQEDAAPAGIWKGPWYRGMTSGTMMLEVSGDGSGSVRFTNLETFGDGPAVLQKTATKAGTYEFAAFGAAGAEFAGSARLIKGGKALGGTARYEGFPIKFELQRAQ